MSAKPWAKVSLAGSPERWAKPCGLVRMYVQDHPQELVRTMRVKWQVWINETVFREGHKGSIRAAKTKATFVARVALVGALESIVGTNPAKWPVS